MPSKQDVILIVVSNAQVGAQLANAPFAAHLQAKHVPDGSTARTRIAEGFISLVALDEDLPDAQGIDLAAEMIQQRPELPTILFGAQDSPELLKRALRNGVVGYLTLPLKPEEVLRAVRAVLRCTLPGGARKRPWLCSPNDSRGCKYRSMNWKR